MAAPAKAARFAETALKAHAKETGNLREPLETRIMDLLTDLMHLAKKRGLDFDSVAQQARAHATAEEAGEY
jgi:Tfp pilus assembly protein PilO